MGVLRVHKLIFVMLLMTYAIFGAVAQTAEHVEPMLSVEPTSGEKPTKVTAVYGVTADDYLPSLETARKHLRPNVRRASSHPDFDLPDAFYFIGGPVFLIILLRVLVIFLNGYEEKRKEEQRVAASESSNPE